MSDIDAPSDVEKERILTHYVPNFKIYTSDTDFGSHARYFIIIPTRGIRRHSDAYVNPVFAVRSAYRTVRNEMSDMVGEIEREV